MKKCYKNLLSVFLCILVLGNSAWGAEALRKEVPVSPYDGKVYMEGTGVGAWDEEGSGLAFLTHNGAVYIPLWTAGQWLGADTLWEEGKQSISIFTNQREPVFPAAAADPAHRGTAGPQEAASQTGQYGLLCPDTKIYLDGESVVFTNVLGEVLPPLSFQGRMYLPVRGVGELMDKKVLWWSSADGAANIYIYETPTAKQNLDASMYWIEVHLSTNRLEDMFIALEEDEGLKGLDLGDSAMQERLAEMEHVLVSIREREAPADNPFCPAHFVEDIRRNADYLLHLDLARYRDPDAWMPSDYAQLGWDWHGEHFFRTLRGDCEALGQAVEELNSYMLAASQLGWKPY